MSTNFIQLTERETDSPICINVDNIGSVIKPGDTTFTRIHLVAEKYGIEVNESYEEVVSLLNPMKINKQEITSADIISTMSGV